MIHGLSNKRRVPRLGRIKLGILIQEPGRKPYPRSVDYFVCPPEVQKLYGEQPRELPVMFPSDDPEAIFPQSLKMYRSAGLWCAGDARTAKRWDDKGRLVERPCPCEYLESGECGPVATLNMLLVDVP